MAIATVTGKTGDATIGATGINMDVSEWSATLDMTMIEVPPAFGSDMAYHVLSHAKVTGSLRGRLQSGTGVGAGPFKTTAGTGGWAVMAGSVTLTAFTGCTISGNVVYSRVEVRLGYDGVGEVTADFANADAVMTVTWA